jgi:hypothetical protein
MAKYLLLVLSGPTEGEGDEATYNDWYDTIHLPDLLAIPGVTAARRYKLLSGNLPGYERWKYAAAYEIETDDLPALFERMENDPRPFSPTYDKSKSANFVAIQISDDA